MVLCGEVVRRYMEWLGSQFAVEQQDGDCIVVTPYEDPWGDLVEIRVSKAPGRGLLVSDRGAATDNLFLSGVEPMDSSNRRKLLEAILQDNQVRLEDGEVIAIAAKEDELPAAVHQVITASTSIQHLVYLARPYAQATFKEKVATFFDEHSIDYSAGETLQGKSSQHRFDFVIPKKDDHIVAIRALSATRPSYANHLAVYSAFAYQDVKILGAPLFALSLLDDSLPGIWVGEPLTILTTYSDAVLPWTRRDDILGMVA